MLSVDWLMFCFSAEEMEDCMREFYNDSADVAAKMETDESNVKKCSIMSLLA